MASAADPTTRPVRVLFAGGGTGGHVYPGIALSAALARRTERYEPAWVGTPDRMEARIVPPTGIPFHPLHVRFLKGTRGMDRVRAFASLPRSVVSALGIVRATRADVVVALGGFVAGPAALAGRLLGRRVVLLEQNAIPGMTGRWIGRFADAVYLSFPGTESHYPAGRGVVMGNPVRRALIERVEALRAAAMGVAPGRTRGAAPRRVLIFGGSQGARALNEALPAVLVAAATQAGCAIDVRHVAGPGAEDAVRARWDEVRGDGPVTVQVDGYVDDMAAAYATCDLVICRSGATSLAELAALGLASVLIPFPHAADDHQTANARHFEAAGAAMRVDESSMGHSRVVDALASLLGDEGRLTAMRASARGLGQPNAGDAIACDLLRRIGRPILDTSTADDGSQPAAVHGEAR